ncbi:GIN domain-containing protein [Salinispirillum marinum]|uniref:GIN domain-containing protein n=2 Tax=Saccharospirillaceae TaxID=255527 RepID=A0ABV8BA00_9GAMM
MIFPLWRLHVLFLSTLLVFAYQSALADTLRQEYPIADVRSVSVGNAAHLTLRQGDRETLYVEATENGLARVEVTQRGDELTLGVSSGKRFFWSWFNRNADRVHFVLEVRDLEHLHVSGAVEAWVEAIDTDTFRLQVSGASEVNVGLLQAETARVQASGASQVTIDRLHTQSLDADASGASQITLANGEPMALLIAQASGASQIEAHNLPTTEANVAVSGASKAQVHALEQLNVEASGASRVDYLGNPRIQQRTSGASNVRAVR